MKTAMHFIMKLICAGILFCISNDLFAQKETEVFIPVGKSPGVSGTYSVIAKVETINLQDSIITLRRDTGIISIRISPGTDVYLDKSKLKLTSTKGACSSIKPGMLVEVKFVDNKPTGQIEWCKVQIE
jgi:hypothetical protein